MKQGRLKDEDLRLWSLVVATVRPHLKSKPKTSHSKPQALATPPSETAIETIHLPGLGEMKAPRLNLTPHEALPPKRLRSEDLTSPARPRLGERLNFDHWPMEPKPIEPKRKRRLSRERDPIEATLDLHGLTTMAAEARLKAFVEQAYAQDYRSVLVITGKGMAETGVLKRQAPEWLSSEDMSPMVAGLSQAHAKHGGSGALYVALKRRS